MGGREKGAHEGVHEGLSEKRETKEGVEHGHLNFTTTPGQKQKPAGASAGKTRTDNFWREKEVVAQYHSATPRAAGQEAELVEKRQAGLLPPDPVPPRNSDRNNGG